MYLIQMCLIVIKYVITLDKKYFLFNSFETALLLYFNILLKKCYQLIDQYNIVSDIRIRVNILLITKKIYK
jgi:hypothetical protein